MDGQPLSEIEFARLKAGRTRPTAWQHVAAEWHRPSDSWQQTVRWTVLAVADEWRRWQLVLPGLLRGDFMFTLALWVAVFSVAAAVLAQPAIPLSVRYSAGLAAVAYLYLYTELARTRRPVPARRFLLGAADVAVVVTLGALTASYAGYAHVLLFFAALRLAARFPDPRVVAVGLLMLVPFELAGNTTPLSLLLDSFTVVMTMLLVVQLTSMTATAEGAIQRQSVVAQLTSSLARVRDEEALFTQLASHVPALGTNCAWAFWTKAIAGDEFRAVRWAGLPDGDMPVFTFTPTLPDEATEAVLINGPLPGTSVGESTLLQPTVGDGLVNGLIMVAGRRRQFDTTTRLLARQVAEEMGATLLRLQTLDEQRQRTEAMEHANRLAGLAARHASDQAGALAAILPAVAETLRSESLHLEWVHGDRLELVVCTEDPLQGHTPGWLALAGTRSADVLQQGHPLREPVTGRRPEDLCLVPAGLRHIAVVPLQCAGVQGTLQISRLLPRSYSSGELLVLQLLADRLGLLFAAGVNGVATSGSLGVRR